MLLFGHIPVSMCFPPKSSALMALLVMMSSSSKAMLSKRIPPVSFRRSFTFHSSCR